MQDIDTGKEKRLQTMSLMQQLFSGSFEVFCAACLTRFVAACVVESSSSSVDYQILWFGLYALFIAHLLSVIVILFFSPRKPSSLATDRLYNYILLVCTENTGFAYKQFSSLVIIKWLGTEQVGVPILAWFILVLLAFSFVYLSNALLILCCISPTAAFGEDTLSNLRNLNSESFSLSLAFSLTLLVSSAIYDTTNNAKFLASLNDDAIEITNNNEKSAFLFLCYAILVTISASLLYNSGLLPSSFQRQNSTNVTVLNNDDGDESREVTVPSRSKDVEEQVYKDRNTSFFWFDSSGNTRSALLHCYNTTLGYLIGASWFAFNVLSWQNLFVSIPAGRILGLFLYALVITLVVLRLLTILSVREERRVLKNGGAQRRKAPLWMISGRLLVGWAWSDFVSEALNACVPIDTTNRGAVGIATKGVVAAFAILAGASFAVCGKREEAESSGDLQAPPQSLSTDVLQPLL